MIRDAKGQLVRRVTTLDGMNYSPAWAPDPAHLVFVSEIDMNDEIYTVNVDGSKTRRLTQNKWEWDKHPSWSVDGKNVVFWSNRETMRKQIWMIATMAVALITSATAASTTGIRFGLTRFSRVISSVSLQDGR